MLDCNFFYVSITEEDGNLVPCLVKQIVNHKSKNVIIFYDQEPLDLNSRQINLAHVSTFLKYSIAPNRVLVTSEYSTEVNLFARDLKSEHAHYFFHGLMCHEWYRQYWFRNIEVNYDFDKTYITYNNLILDKRLYRANLVSELHTNGLVDSGLISYNPPSGEEIIASADSYAILPTAHKVNIHRNIDILTKPLVIDTKPHGALSAEINIEDMQRAFVNLVTETVFYENKVHLTEKIFKPIIAKIPFLLMSGSGNLAYLKKYGFKTFGDYWDEGYDDMTNNVDRFNAIMSILKDLSNRPHHELVDMKKDMTHILEHNFNHFFKDMRSIVVDEFTQNLGNSLTTANIPFDQLQLNHMNSILKF